MSMEDGNSGGGASPEELAKKAGLEWVTRALSRMECSDLQRGTVYSIVSRIMREEGVSQQDIISELAEKKVDGFIAKHTKNPSSVPPKKRPSGFLPAAEPKKHPSTMLAAARESFARATAHLDEGTQISKDVKGGTYSIIGGAPKKDDEE